MLSPHIYAALVQERHRDFLAQAETDRRNRRARPRRPRNGAALSGATASPRLSDRYRRLRFLSPKPACHQSSWAIFTDVDHHDHEALGALDRDDDHAGRLRNIDAE